jgi:hypothetical protein
VKINTTIKVLILIMSIFNHSTLVAQIEEGRPVVILLTPETTYAGSLDDDSPQYETSTIQGLFSNEIEGMIEKLFAVEILLNGVFYNGLGINPDMQMIILALPPQNSRETWLKIVSILFDTFEIPSLYIHEANTWNDAITPELTPGEKLYWIARDNNKQDP